MKLTRTGRVRLAAALWIAVAALLTYRGLVPHLGNMATTGGRALALGVGLLFGGAKGWFVLSKSAARTARYIAGRPERDWPWLAVHPVLYLLIPLMIGLGVLVRHRCAQEMPGVVVGLYVGVAAAMLIGCRGFRRPAAAAGPGGA